MYTKTTLNNGLRLILCPREGTEAVTLLVMVKVGSRYEPIKLWGATHFIEHFMFKGTSRRPNSLLISKELDGIGAEYNAFTSKDSTGYFIKADSSHFELIVDILSDMLLHSLFDEKEIEREKQVISEEIKMYFENPMMHIENLFEQEIFQGNTLGRDIAGTKKSVMALDRKTVLKYQEEYYIPNNIIIGVGGNFKNTAKPLIEKYFAFSKKVGKKTKPFPAFRVLQKRPRFVVDKRDVEQAQVILGFPAFHYTDKRLPALSLLSIILGGNMSSRLFVRVREQLGLAYFVQSGLNAYEDIGSFQIQAGLDKKRTHEAIEAIGEELKNIKEHPVSDQELQRAKDHFRGKVMLKLEDSFALAEWHVREEFMKGKIETPEEKLKKIDRVTKEQIQNAAREVMRKNMLNLAIVGDVSGGKKIQGLIEFL